jgi:hypothetical protein
MGRIHLQFTRLAHDQEVWLMRHRILVLGAILSIVPLAGCRVSVDKETGTAKARVSIQTPFADVKVRTDLTPDTGLPVYPGAKPIDNSREPKGADVDVGNSFFGVKVIAARFTSNDAPEQVAGFYRRELRAYGEVMECHGNIDFTGPLGHRRPYCKPHRMSGTIQLAAGLEERHRLVVVKPRGDGSELSVVYLQTRGAS